MQLRHQTWHNRIFQSIKVMSLPKLNKKFVLNTMFDVDSTFDPGPQTKNKYFPLYLKFHEFL